MAGARVEGMVPMSLRVPTQGFNITVVSYRGELHFGAIGDPNLMDGIWEIADAIPKALVEFEQAAAQDPRRSSENPKLPQQNGRGPPGPDASSRRHLTQLDRCWESRGQRWRHYAAAGFLRFGAGRGGYLPRSSLAWTLRLARARLAITSSAAEAARVEPGSGASTAPMSQIATRSPSPSTGRSKPF
jgi:hypothetical protein